MSTARAIFFKLSDDDLPPAAPVQMTAAGLDSSLGSLGEKVKQALQGNNPFGPRILLPPNRIPVPRAVPPKQAPRPVPKQAPPPDK